MALKTNNLLEEYELNVLEVFLRVLFYYITILVVLVVLQIATADIFIELFKDFSNTDFLVVNSLRGLTGIAGILITVIFLKYDQKTLNWSGFSWARKGVIISIISLLLIAEENFDIFIPRVAPPPDGENFLNNKK